MATTFNDLSDAELGRLLRRRYDDLCAAHDAGMSDEHPSESWARDSETLKAYREASATGGIAGKVAGKDNPSGGSAQPRSPVAGKDSATAADIEDAAIKRSGHHDVEGQLALAAARRSNPGRVRAMAQHIKGYGK